MDAVVKDEEWMAGLATNFFIRGAQLAVVRWLDTRYIVCSRCLRLVAICVHQDDNALELGGRLRRNKSIRTLRMGLEDNHMDSRRRNQR